MRPHRHSAAASALSGRPGSRTPIRSAGLLRARAAMRLGIVRTVLTVLGALVLALPVAAQPAPAPGLDADLGPERPVALPDPLTSPQLDPRQALHFGVGLPVMDVRSEQLGERLQGGAPVDRGVLMHVDAVSDPWRFGYVRQLFRANLPEGTTFAGASVDALAIDSDQLWAFHGWRVHHSVYLGYGLGWQRRRVRVLSEGYPVRTLSESTFMAGLLADWVFRAPFALELRAFGDLSEGFVETRGTSLQLSYTVGF